MNFAENIFHAQQGNVQIGDSDLRLSLNEMQMPELNLVTVDHSPGGGIMGMAWTMDRIEALSPTFSIQGDDFNLEKYWGQKHRIIFIAAVKNKYTGKLIGDRVVIEGVLASHKPDGQKGGDLRGNSYEIKEVTHYSITLEGQERRYFDFFENEPRIDGKPIFKVNEVLNG